MSPEQESKLKEALEIGIAWESDKGRTDLDKNALAILNSIPEPAALRERVEWMHHKIEFILELPKIKKRTLPQLEKPATHDQRERIEKNLLKYIALAREKNVLFAFRRDETWAGVDISNGDISDVLNDLEARLQKLATFRNEHKKKQGIKRRPEEYWQFFLIKELERGTEEILLIDAIKTPNSIFTKIVQLMLQEIGDSAYSDRHEIVKDIYPKLEELAEKLNW